MDFLRVFYEKSHSKMRAIAMTLTIALRSRKCRTFA